MNGVMYYEVRLLTATGHEVFSTKLNHADGLSALAMARDSLPGKQFILVRVTEDVIVPLYSEREP